MTATQATPVRYRGINYRSRLEAKWAALFHHLRWDATYRPYGDDVPSFLVVHGDDSEFLTVTDAATPTEYTEDQAWADEARPDLDVAVVGLCPVPDADGAWHGLAIDDVRAAWAKATNDITGLR